MAWSLYLIQKKVQTLNSHWNWYSSPNKKPAMGWFLYILSMGSAIWQDFNILRRKISQVSRWKLNRKCIHFKGMPTKLTKISPTWRHFRAGVKVTTICENSEDNFAKMTYIITLTSQWARWRLKSPASGLFTHMFIQVQIKENIKAPRHWIHRGPVNSPHKRPVTRKMFSFDDVIMWFSVMFHLPLLLSWHTTL